MGTFMAHLIFRRVQTLVGPAAASKRQRHAPAPSGWPLEGAAASARRQDRFGAGPFAARRHPLARPGRSSSGTRRARSPLERSPDRGVHIAAVLVDVLPAEV